MKTTNKSEFRSQSHRKALIKSLGSESAFVEFQTKEIEIMFNFVISCSRSSESSAFCLFNFIIAFWLLSLFALHSSRIILVVVECLKHENFAHGRGIFLYYWSIPTTLSFNLPRASSKWIIYFFENLSLDGLDLNALVWINKFVLFFFYSSFFPCRYEIIWFQFSCMFPVDGSRISFFSKITSKGITHPQTSFNSLTSSLIFMALLQSKRSETSFFSSKHFLLFRFSSSKAISIFKLSWGFGFLLFMFLKAEKWAFFGARQFVCVSLLEIKIYATWKLER